MLKWIADSMALMALGVIGYIICVATDRKPMAQLVVMVTIMLFLLTTIQDLTPTVRHIQSEAQSVQQKINALSAPIGAARKAKTDLEKSPIVQFGARGGWNR